MRIFTDLGTSWFTYFGSPDATWLGLMNAVLPLGVIVVAIPAGWMSDAIGRRYTMMIGIVILVAAAAMQAASHNIATFIVARFFIGAGIELSSVPAPVLITEIAYPSHRGKAKSLFQTCFFLGAIASSWCTFALQAFFPVLQFIGLWFVPESPRWLVGKGRHEEAHAFLVKYYAGGDESNPIVEYEYREISSHIETEQAAAGMGWSSLWKTPADRKRLAITAFTAFVAQWAGIIITYYLSLVLESVGIKESFTKTLINGIHQIFNYIVAIFGALLVDRVGRRTLWIFSAIGMLVTYSIFTACSAVFAETGKHTVAMVVVVFILIYYFFYDIAVTPLTFAYPAEILPFHTRQKGLAVCNLCNGLALIFNSFVNLIALEAIAWKYHLVYIVLLMFIAVITYLFFAETKGYTLEDIADVFEGPAIVAGSFRRPINSRQELPIDVKEAPVSMIEDISN
ncbi:hypothetical protein N7507_003286 [Penicillium longicatenatum]|nr:hypothetical protein N7507_003286 [Penicillium longicatenatum]